MITIKENYFGVPKHYNKNIEKIDHLLNMGQFPIDTDHVSGYSYCTMFTRWFIFSIFFIRVLM